MLMLKKDRRQIREKILKRYKEKEKKKKKKNWKICYRKKEI